ncbi:conserved hypothetical protein [Photorhabdus asymbiotica]|uniref:Uncharacterized protein n=1 Tax=Photorhabdus asymbiotica subsp. asymbiotica (strain ATCC 43949 / 3105-77) TaxID=553480 RepID=C7BMT0_PHOAA|nr:conserved hypothetical protein [Photorhabdus asymbiotica]
MTKLERTHQVLDNSSYTRYFSSCLFVGCTHSPWSLS